MEELLCTVCPNQCRLLVETQGKEVIAVSENRCDRGVEFAKEEMICPKRILTTTILVTDSDSAILVPVRSRTGIGLDQHIKIMSELRKLNINKTLDRGEVIYPNICNTGVDIITSVSSADCRVG